MYSSGLGSNAARSSDQSFGQLNDTNHHLQQQGGGGGKLNATQTQQQQLQMQQQLQQQQMLQSGLNPQQQQGQNIHFSADGSANHLVNQSVNPFTGQQQLQGQQQTIQSLQPQSGLPGQQLQTSSYNSVFPNNALSQMDQQQQMALQQQQQLQLQQRLGQNVSNNPMMGNENAAGLLFQQGKQLTQINSISSNPVQQQQQPYGLVNTTASNNYVQQVAQVSRVFQNLISYFVF